MSNVIIGAGQCGRGYLARLLYLSKEPIIFIDEDVALIEALNQQQSYQITFCGSDRPSFCIDHYQAYSWKDEESIRSLAQADVIFTSVGESNLTKLLPYLQKALKLRTKQKAVKLITAENGTAPKEKLRCLEGIVELSESVIFCTTIRQANTLHIISEDLDYLPYDRQCLSESLSFHGMVEEYDFRTLLKRKIYTYNTLSAGISYLGAYLQYENYAEAANDPAILAVLNVLEAQINEMITAQFCIDTSLQQEFSQMAMKKFRNKEIVDTIERNARDVQRKLGKSERIIAPMKLMIEQHLDPKPLILICAAALWYGAQTQTFDLRDLHTKNEWIASLRLEFSDELLQRVLNLFQGCLDQVAFSSLCQEAGL